MQPVTVFGGTGFLGRRIVDRLAAAGAEVRVASRHPKRRQAGAAPDRVVPVRADIRDPASIAAAVEGAGGVVNAVSAYVEKGDITYPAIHERGARELAEACARHQVGALVLISGIGADPASSSRYIRARGRGEALVREAFPDAIILRPSVMFGPDDAFIQGLLSASAISPVFPLFGGGRGALQPVHVEDVAEAACRALGRPDSAGTTYELGGPRVYSFREIVELVLAQASRRRMLLPVPFAAARLGAWLLQPLPNPPLTKAQVELLESDSTVDPNRSGFKELGIEPRSLESALAETARGAPGG